MTCRGGPARIRDVPTQGESRMAATVRLGLVAKSFVGSRLPSFRGAMVRGCPHPSPLDSGLRRNDEWGAGVTNLARGNDEVVAGMTTWVAGRWGFAAPPTQDAHSSESPLQLMLVSWWDASGHYWDGRLTWAGDELQRCGVHHHAVSRYGAGSSNALPSKARTGDGSAQLRVGRDRVFSKQGPYSPVMGRFRRRRFGPAPVVPETCHARRSMR